MSGTESVEPIEDMTKKMNGAIKNLKEDLSKIHSGQANPAMIEDIEVEYYGTNTPLNQISNIAAPDSGLLVVQPYDSSQIDSIERAIMEADLGLNPNNDGNVVRVPIPKLSGERRKELVKMIKDHGQESKVAIRNIRREANKEIDSLEEKGDITEDDNYMLKEEVDEITDEMTEKVDELVENKIERVRSI